MKKTILVLACFVSALVVASVGEANHMKKIKHKESKVETERKARIKVFLSMTPTQVPSFIPTATVTPTPIP